MKKLLSIAILLFINIHAFSQQNSFTIKKGPNFENEKKKSQNSFVLGSNATSYFTYREEKNLIINQYNIGTMAQENEFTIEEFEYNGNDAELIKVNYVKGEFHAFYNSHDSKEDQKSLIVKRFSEDGKAISQPQLIAAMPSKKDKDSYIDIKPSADSSKYLINYQYLDRGKKDLVKLLLKVVDSDYDEVWKSQKILDYTTRSFGIICYDVSNAGDIFITAQIRESNTQENRLLKFTANSQKDIKLPNYLLFAMPIINSDLTPRYIGKVMIDNEENSLKIFGLHYYVGVFGTSINLETLEREYNIKSEIPKEFKLTVVKETTLEKKNNHFDEQFRRIIVKDLIKMDNGEYTLVGESIHLDQMGTRNSEGKTSFEVQYFNIYIFRFNPDGTLKWANRVKKNQTYSSLNTKSAPDSPRSNTYLNRGFSYSVVPMSNQLHIIFNDHKNNTIENQYGRALPNGTGTASKNFKVAIVTVNNDNSIAYTDLTGKNAFETFMNPLCTYKLNNKQFIIFGHYGRENECATITVN